MAILHWCNTLRRIVACKWRDGRWLAIVTGLAMAVLLIESADNAYARGRSRGRRGRAAAVTAAQRQRTIKAVQNEIAAARKLLSEAQSAAGMSRERLIAASQQVAAARSAIEAADGDDDEAHRRLRDIEFRILSAQGPDSEFAQATAAVVAGRAALDRELHRIIGLPEHPESKDDAARLAETAELTEEQRQLVQSDAGYQSALKDLTQAVSGLAQVRRKLLEQDAEWSSASRTHQAAEEQVQQEEAAARRAGLAARESRREFRNAEEAAAAARAVIALGEARLQALGARAH